MIFTETKLKGAFVIAPDRHTDDRGSFARVFCQREFAAHGLNSTIAQSNNSRSARKGTLRGMHFQYPPGAETKLVRCIRGAIIDIIVDLRPESPTYLEHVAVELDADNMCSLYVPQRFAHGHQTLQDNTEIIYQMGDFYAPAYERGLKHDDPRLGLHWPLPVEVISQRDSAFPRFDEIEAEVRERMAVRTQDN